MSVSISRPACARLADAGLEQQRADAAAARLGPHHHADDVADVADLDALVALAADRADEALAAPGAEHELAAVAPVEAEPVQVVGGSLRASLSASEVNASGCSASISSRSRL